MLKRDLLVFGVLAGSTALTTATFAQLPAPPDMPSAAMIAHADQFDPPKLGQYTERLAQQPDMSGTWTTMVPTGGGNGPVFDPVHTVYPPALAPGSSTFGPLPGTYIKDIPYNAEYQKKYQALIKETTEGKSRDTFPACTPFGIPRMLGASPTPFDIIQSPDVMIWYGNYVRTERRIFLNQTKHRLEEDPTTGGTGPSLSGDSIGHWEGNTMVIDTVNLSAGYFDETPAPYSDQLHMVERVRLIDNNILQDQMTFTDPVTMLKPWVVTRYYRRGNGGQEIVRRYLPLNDRICVPNVRMDANGFQVAILPSELESSSVGNSDQSPSRN